MGPRSSCASPVIPHICLKLRLNLPLQTPISDCKLRLMKPIVRTPQGPRVNLTLTDEAVAILDRIGAVTKTGRATILREFVLEALPGIVEIAHALELAQQKNLDAFKVMAKSIDKTVADSQQLSLDIKKTRRRAMRRKVEK